MVIVCLQVKGSTLRTHELVEGFRAVGRTARAEKGFIACRISQDVDDPGTIRYEERWSNAPDLEAETRSPRFTQLLTLMELAYEQPTLEFHFVPETKGLEYIAAARGQPGPES